MPTYVHPMSAALVPFLFAPADRLSPGAPSLIYDNSADITLKPGTKTVVGSRWGVNPLNVSEIDDVHDGHLVRVDSYEKIGAYDNVTMLVTFQTGGIPYEEAVIGDGHHYGYSSCETFGRCDHNHSEHGDDPIYKQRVGSVCREGKGFCYTSAIGTLECGRTIRTHDRFGGNVHSTIDQFRRYPYGWWGSRDTTGQVDMTGRHPRPEKLKRLHPCPRGTPNLNGGATGTVTVAKRLLLAGCMLTADAHYLPSAEVHVPQMCAAPAHYRRGCMFPGAINYDPGSVEPGWCQYVTRGCTDPNAHNYNSQASLDDGSCVLRIQGCTLHPEGYHEVNPDTPGYKGRFGSQPYRGVGRVPWPSYGTVLNYDPGANSLYNCSIAIEGCRCEGKGQGGGGEGQGVSSYGLVAPAAPTASRPECHPLHACVSFPLAHGRCSNSSRAPTGRDPAAVNYDPAATVNTGTWCVPRVKGCMVPSSWSGGAVRAANGRDYGGATNFDPGATVIWERTNKRNFFFRCRSERWGCMDTSALNYDRWATVNYDCHFPLRGCLDPVALNFGCTTFEGQYEHCTTVNAKTPNATVHIPYMCTYDVAPPPAPALPPGTFALYQVVVDFVSDGDVANVDNATTTAMQQTFAREANVEEDAVSVSYSAGSVIFSVSIFALDSGKADDISRRLEDEVSSAEALNAFLVAGGVSESFVVLAPPKLSVGRGEIAQQPPPPSKVPLIAGIVSGAMSFLCGCCLCIYCFLRKRYEPKVAYIVPA